MRIRISFFLSFIGFLCIALLPTTTFAHPLDVSYLDIGVTSSSKPVLTVAVHPYQAFELIRNAAHPKFNLEYLQQSGDLISAYVQDHVEISSGGQICEWKVAHARIPKTEIEAIADGITIAGEFYCAVDSVNIRIAATLFTDGFSSQKNIIRFELPDGFADRVTLDKKNIEATVDISELYSKTKDEISQTASIGRSGGDFSILAVQALKGDMSWMQIIGLLFSACFIGAVHAFGPGHGKSFMAAALIGQKPSFKKAFTLGGLMAATHVSDVFIMTLLAGGVLATFPPGKILDFLEYFSALGLFLLGILGIFTAIFRYRNAVGNQLQTSMDENHARAHALGLPHTHEEEQQQFKKALWMGFIGSLAPCPTAWAIFMATISLGKWGMGVALLIAFSIGLSVTVISIGCLMVVSTSFMLKKASIRITYMMPIISSTIICVLGGWLLWRSF